jgi:SAM-dependent methyltransferase
MAALTDRVGALLERWPSVKALAFLAENGSWRIRHRLGRIRTRYGTHMDASLQESVDYVEAVFADYLRYGELRAFHGRVAELGPGDNAGVALLMRQSGAERVDLIERFQPYADETQQAKIYEALSARHGLASFRSGDRWRSGALRGVRWVYGQRAEDYLDTCADSVYDFIVSRAVLEHLARPLDALRQMCRVLQPGGLLLHEVDLRDHGHFSRTHDELTWLRFSSRLWRAMTSHSGRPNRIPLNRYRQTLEGLRESDGITYRLLVKSLVGDVAIEPGIPYDEIPIELRQRAVSFVESRRSSFAREFQEVDAADLAVATFFIVARKPPSAAHELLDRAVPAVESDPRLGGVGDIEAAG